MTQNPIVAFGLCATSAALNAKCGRVNLRDHLILATTTLKLVPMDADACAAVAGFLAEADRNPVLAGGTLQRFVIDWLDTLPMAAAEDVVAGVSPDALYDWQKRADLQ